MKDKISLYSIFMAIGLLVCHCWQFYNSGWMIEPLIRIVFYVVYIIVVMIAGRKAIPFLFLVLALVLVQFMSFTNYTCFIVCCLFCAVYDKAKWPIFIVYVLDVLIVCYRHDKTEVHIIIHFMNCAFILFSTKIIFNRLFDKLHKKHVKKLLLDPVDRYILNELANGKKQKEIQHYSENTISKRLKKMRERNFCFTNQELILWYLEETQ